MTFFISYDFGLGSILSSLFWGFKMFIFSPELYSKSHSPTPVAFVELLCKVSHTCLHSFPLSPQPWPSPLHTIPHRLLHFRVWYHLIPLQSSCKSFGWVLQNMYWTHPFFSFPCCFCLVQVAASSYTAMTPKVFPPTPVPDNLVANVTLQSPDWEKTKKELLPSL